MKKQLRNLKKILLQIFRKTLISLKKTAKRILGKEKTNQPSSDMIIALCGFMTSGKTLAGEALSEKTGRKLIDLDQYIEQKEGMDMESIFRVKGEAYFREKEEESLRQIVKNEDDIILSLGGGTPMNPKCAKILKEKTRCIFLTCSPKVLAERMLLLQDGRPLVKSLLAQHPNSTKKQKLQILEHWAKEKLQEREPIYKACSVKTVDTSDWNIERIIGEILRG
ncbi:MAG: shikimate kinase [Bacteroidales bacterium]|nr:shikimate kinase [Bacteroidales bacterium]